MARHNIAHSSKQLQILQIKFPFTLSPFANDLLLFNMTLTIVQSLQCHTIIKLCLCKD